MLTYLLLCGLFQSICYFFSYALEFFMFSPLAGLSEGVKREEQLGYFIFNINPTCPCFGMEIFVLHSLRKLTSPHLLNAIRSFGRRKTNYLSGCIEPCRAKSYQPTLDAFKQNFVIRICDAEVTLRCRDE